MEMLQKPVFKDYSLRNLQARIIANLITHSIFAHQAGSIPFDQQIQQTLTIVTDLLSE